MRARHDQETFRHETRTIAPPRPADLGHAAERAAIASAIAIALAPAAHAVTNVTWEDILRDQESTGDVLTYRAWASRPNATRRSSTSTPATYPASWPGLSPSATKNSAARSPRAMVFMTVRSTLLPRTCACFASTPDRQAPCGATSHRLPDDIRPCCDVVYRGAAIFGDKIYFGTLDARVVALDEDTGKVVWNEKFGDHRCGYTMTGAPIIMQGQKIGKILLIHGGSGDEFGVVGELYARDPEPARKPGAPVGRGPYGPPERQGEHPDRRPQGPSWPNDPNRPTGKVEAWSQGGGAPWQSATLRCRNQHHHHRRRQPRALEHLGAHRQGRRSRLATACTPPGQVDVDPTTGEVKWLLPAHAQRRLGLLGQQRAGAVRLQGPKSGKTGQGHAPTPTATASSSSPIARSSPAAPIIRQAHRADQRLPLRRRHHLGQGLRPATGRPIETGNRPPSP